MKPGMEENRTQQKDELNRKMSSDDNFELWEQFHLDFPVMSQSGQVEFSVLCNQKNLSENI